MSKVKIYGALGPAGWNYDSFIADKRQKADLDKVQGIRTEQ